MDKNVKKLIKKTQMTDEELEIAIKNYQIDKTLANLEEDNDDEQEPDTKDKTPPSNSGNEEKEEKESTSSEDPVEEKEQEKASQPKVKTYTQKDFEKAVASKLKELKVKPKNTPEAEPTEEGFKPDSHTVISKEGWGYDL